MNYVDNHDLEAVSLFLTDREMGNSVLNGRISLFSVASPKLPTVFENDESSEFQQSSSSSPSSTGSGDIGRRPRSNSLESFPSRPKNAKRSSSLGDLSAPSSRKLFLDLIKTLNVSFPDYDFYATKLEQFVERDLVSTMKHINTSLAELTESNPNFLEKFWRSIDQAMSLRKCEIFYYVADHEGDPFSQGNLWSINCFFFNQQRMQLCYFTCVATSKYRGNRMLLGKYSTDNSDDDQEYDDDEDDSYDMEVDEGGESNSGSMDDEDDEHIPDWEGVI